MSKVSIQGDISGTGDFTIKAPNSNVDRTLNLPDEAGTVLTNVSDIEPQVKTATNATGSAPVYACRAWVNVNALSLTINGSGNISSVTDEGAGRTKINFTDAMVDADYSAVGTVRRSDDAPSNPYLTGSINHTTSSVEFIIIDFDGTELDSGIISTAVFR